MEAIGWLPRSRGPHKCVGDDTIVESAFSPGFALPGKGGQSIVGAPWAYDGMGVVDWDSD